jgi:pimeloyl-ACP methyl ester carboxylesterase
LVATCLLATLNSSAAETGTREIGSINGVAYRIDVPEHWNRGLVLYCHGYALSLPVFKDEPPSRMERIFLDKGYAVAQSAYAETGWDIDDAVRDTEALRNHFTDRFGKPVHTYVAGHSLGGYLVLVLMETKPRHYDGGLALCAPLAPAEWFMSRRAFDLRVVFDYYFPNLLPDPTCISASFDMNNARTQVASAVTDHPSSAAELLRYGRLRTTEDLVDAVLFFTEVLKDIEHRAGGNPFDNSNTIYEGTSNDKDLNDGVRRYQSSPTAAAFLRQHYTPTGYIRQPLVAIATTYDQYVPDWVTNAYETSLQPNSRDLFVQRYVNGSGHCDIPIASIAAGFQSLSTWREKGIRPEATGMTGK